MDHSTALQTLAQSLPSVTAETTTPAALPQQIEQWTSAPELLRLFQLAKVVWAIITLARRLERQLLPGKAVANPFTRTCRSC